MGRGVMQEVPPWLPSPEVGCDRKTGDCLSIREQSDETIWQVTAEGQRRSAENKSKETGA
eukprot:1159784-Pelagomonas_calceolata.AAC.5